MSKVLQTVSEHGFLVSVVLASSWFSLLHFKYSLRRDQQSSYCVCLGSVKRDCPLDRRISLSRCVFVEAWLNMFSQTDYHNCQISVTVWYNRAIYFAARISKKVMIFTYLRHVMATIVRISPSNDKLKPTYVITSKARMCGLSGRTTWAKTTRYKIDYTVQCITKDVVFWYCYILEIWIE